MKLHELTPAAQQRAYENWNTLDYDWWDGVYEMAKEDGKERGFIIDDINFSGFSSQGDGACWKGYVDLPVFFNHFRERNDCPLTPQQVLLLSSALEGIYDSHAGIGVSGNYYCHSGTMGIDWDHSYLEGGTEIAKGAYRGMDEGTFEEVWSLHAPDIEKVILQAARDFADEIYKNLGKEHDCLTSEEAFKEACEANGYEFTEEGEWA